MRRAYSCCARGANNTVVVARGAAAAGMEKMIYGRRWRPAAAGAARAREAPRTPSSARRGAVAHAGAMTMLMTLMTMSHDDAYDGIGNSTSPRARRRRR